MAVMIPSVLPAKGVAPGEEDIFLRLRDDPLTKDWIVLHSLDIAHHRRQVAGEVDFVVIVPHKGVLCLEIKSHFSIRRDNGLWYYGNDPRPELRGPFKQAAEGMFSVQRRVTRGQSELGPVVFWSAVVFPRAPFNVASDEWHPWQVIDSQTYRSTSIGTSITYVLDKAREFLRDVPNARWFDPDSTAPDPDQCALIAKILRPDFEFFESPQSRSGRLQDELKRYTVEQFAALDAMASNPRVIFCGPAGTGKTTLAIEAVRRSVNSGMKVLFLCFNGLLGDKLAEESGQLRPAVTTRTLHGHMLKIVQHVEVENTPQFWQDQLPAMAIDALMESNGGDFLFDELVIDEAQDIFRDKYLEFLDLSLKGGLASGHWRIFGDFEKQAIYGAANIALDTFRQTRSGQAPVYSLRVNCRNTPRIAEFVHLLGGLAPKYSRILRPDSGVEPELNFYDSLAAQQKLLADVLDALADEGSPANETVVLSPRADKYCLAASIQAVPWQDRLRPIALAKPGSISYCSIQSYKGMESPIVVVTDIEQITGEQWQSLFYIAVTRSLHRLILLFHTNTRAEMISILTA